MADSPAIAFFGWRTLLTLVVLVGCGNSSAAGSGSTCRTLTAADGVCCCKPWIKLICVEGNWHCELGPEPTLGSCDMMVDNSHYQQVCPGFGTSEYDDAYASDMNAPD